MDFNPSRCCLGVEFVDKNEKDEVEEAIEKQFKGLSGRYREVSDMPYFYVIVLLEANILVAFALICRSQNTERYIIYVT